MQGGRSEEEGVAKWKEQQQGRNDEKEGAMRRKDRQGGRSKELLLLRLKVELAQASLGNPRQA